MSDKMSGQDISNMAERASRVRAAYRHAGYGIASQYTGWAKAGGVSFGEFQQSKAWERIKNLTSTVLRMSRGSTNVVLQVSKAGFEICFPGGSELVDRISLDTINRMRELLDKYISDAMEKTIGRIKP